MKRIMILVAIFLMASAVFAQDGLSDEEVALLERVDSIFMTFDETTESFTVEYLYESTTTSDLNMSGVSQASTNSMATGGTVIVINPDSPEQNISGQLVGAYEEETGGIVMSYTIQADVIYVDGNLYVNASYLETEGEVPELPEGWTLVEDIALYPQSPVLRLSEFLYEEDEDETELSEIMALATRVESEITEEGEIVTVYFDWAAMETIMTQEDPAAMENPMMGLFSESAEGDIMALSVLLSEDDSVLADRQSSELSIENADLVGVMDGVPEGTTFTYYNATEEINFYSGINETYEPAVAPNME